MSPSRRERALKLALETQSAILSDTTSVSSILRRCLTICQLLDREDENKWIELELNGYGSGTVGELEKAVPAYRKTRVMYYNEYDRPILIGNRELARILQSYPIPNAVSELEDYVEGGLRVYGAHTNLIRKQFKISAAYCQISSIFVRRIVESAKNRALEFVNKTVIELEFENVLSDIFERTRSFVDTKLAEVCPEVLENLVDTYKDLSAIAGPHNWKKIAFACRDILQDFTDAIYEPEYLPKDETAPRREQTQNKVRYTLMAKLKGSSTEERRLVEVQIEYFDRLTDYINKHLHRHTDLEEAHRCVMYTYLIIGDILKLLAT